MNKENNSFKMSVCKMKVYSKKDLLDNLVDYMN